MRIARRHPGWTLGAAALVGAALLAWVLVSGGENGRAGCAAALAPAYVGPELLRRFVTSRDAPDIVVMNPANGPGRRRDAWAAAVDAAHHSGARVLGYVHTGYGTRPPDEALADARRYRSWYGADGVFLDEVSPSVELLPHYRRLADGARAAGLDLIALNPGVVPARGYFGIADVVVTYEGPYVGYEAALAAQPGWVRHLPSGATAHLIYAATRDQAREAVAARAGARVYATPGRMPNPWATLPGHDWSLTGGCR